MKKLLVLGLILLAVGLYAQPYGVYVRFIDANTGLDYTDISTIQFEVELDPPSGDMQMGPSGLCFVMIQDLSFGPQSFVQFDLANFANPYTPTSIIRVKIWDTNYPDGFAELYAQKDIDLDPSTGFLGWGAFMGGLGGDPLEVFPEDPVPVTLSNFATAVFVNEFVEISWTTQSCTNMSLWNLYRQDPGATEQVIIHTTEAINSTETQNYNFEDTYVEIGQTYNYYLEAIDYDGTTFMYGPVSATMLGEDIPDLPNQTELFGNHPNPFNPATFINFNVKENETATLTIFNTKGQLVMNRTFNAGFYNYNWQADSNPSGVYFYKLQSESHTSVKKMLLLK